jgi:hypothetical protein
MKTTNLLQDVVWFFSAAAIVAAVLFFSTPIYAQSEKVWESRQHAWYAGRQGHDMAHIGGWDKALLFGGFNNGRFQDTWIYDSSVGDWEPGDQNITIKPSNRYAHAMAYVGGGKVVLFSGNALGGSADDTWIYDLSTRTWTQKYPPDPPTPSARSTHAMAYIGDDKALLFSGFYYEVRNFGTVTYNESNETWIYDLSDNTWTPQNKPFHPINRSNAAMAYIGGSKVVLFGGDHKYRRTNGGINIFNNNETWIYDLTQNTWTQKHPSVKPHERSRHAMAYIGGDQVVMFGGHYEEITGTGTVGKWLGDTWVYDLSENKWTEYTHNYHPSARSSFSFSETSMNGSKPPVLFGGIDSDGYPMELWSFTGGKYLRKDPTYLTVYSPNGGEIWVVGSLYQIQWGTDSRFGQVKIEISTTGGSSWSEVTARTANNGRYNYTPDRNDISRQCLIRITWLGTSTPVPIKLNALNGYNGAIPFAWERPRGTSVSFSSSTAPVVAKGMATDSKLEERSLNIPIGNILGIKSESQQIESSPLVLRDGFAAKKMRDKQAKIGERPDFSLQSQGSVPEVLSYNIYRNTSPEGSFTKIGSNIQHQYYRDETAVNGVFYYYKVTAVYSDGESDDSNIADAIAETDGYTILSAWTNTPPDIYGMITPGEWSTASITNITYPGLTGVVTLYVMNDNNYLYVAVDDGRDNSLEDSDQLALSFDEDLNREFPSSAPSGEGIIWLTWSQGSSFSQFEGYYGYWPQFGRDAIVHPQGVNGYVGFRSDLAKVQYEVMFDLTTSPINASPGETIGVLFNVWGKVGTNIPDGVWPQATVPGFNNSGPFVFGDLKLAEPSDLDPPTNLVALNDYHNVVPLAWSVPSEQVVSYKVYRSTNSGVPYTIIAENVVRQYYRDETAVNGQTYYYVVKAIYSTGQESVNSNEAVSQPQRDGYVIKSGLATSAPTLDGMINPDEWSEAATTNITYPGYTGVVTQYIMNDNNYLYVAVDDGRDTSLEDRDQLALFFDDDLNREFPPSAPSTEGVIWVAWDAASNSSFSVFGSRYGYWPENIGSETNVPTPGVDHGMSLASGNVQYEGSYDLRTSPLNAHAGEIIGILSYTFDKDPNSFNAFWPQQVVGLGAITPSIGSWGVAPFSYGDLVLAFSPSDNILINGNFSNGETNWNLTVLGAGQATSSVQNGEYAISIAHGGNFMWDINLTQGNLPIENGKTYKVSFDAYAAAPRQIAVLVGKNSDPWTVYSGLDNFVSLTTSKQTFEYSFTMNNPTDPVARVGFDVGLSTDDVYFDNITLTGPTTVADDPGESASLPTDFNLLQNYPNPFNPATTIAYRLPQSSEVALTIYDLQGHQVRMLYVVRTIGTNAIEN